MPLHDFSQFSVHPADWDDPIRTGWPGPMRSWDQDQLDTFDHAHALALADGLHKALAFATAYGAVTRMKAGRR